jgi:hypothetical protein
VFKTRRISIRIPIDSKKKSVSVGILDHGLKAVILYQTSLFKHRTLSRRSYMGTIQQTTSPEGVVVLCNPRVFFFLCSAIQVSHEESNRRDCADKRGANMPFFCT